MGPGLLSLVTKDPHEREELQSQALEEILPLCRPCRNGLEIPCSAHYLCPFHHI